MLFQAEDREDPAEKARSDVTSWFNRLDAIVIGPGLGQDALNHRCAKLILHSAREHNVPLILDADSLYLVTKGRMDLLSNEMAMSRQGVDRSRSRARILGGDLDAKCE